MMTETRPPRGPPPKAEKEDIDKTIGAILPQVENLLSRIGADSGVLARTKASDFGGYHSSVPISFPDGIGRGSVIALLFPHNRKVRLDISIEHNRVFAKSNGEPSDQRCFHNDFMASIQVPVGAVDLSKEFERHVLLGIKNAQEAVGRHNRSPKSGPGWFQIRITERK